MSPLILCARSHARPRFAIWFWLDSLLFYFLFNFVYISLGLHYINDARFGSGRYMSYTYKMKIEYSIYN